MMIMMWMRMLVTQIDSYSAFYDNGHLTHTELHELLSQRGIATLYVVGLATDYCVYYSAKDASALGRLHFVSVQITGGGLVKR